MKKIVIFIGVILLFASGVFANDVSIDSTGNVTTGTSNTDANLEVLGASGEHGIVGETSGTGQQEFTELIRRTAIMVFWDMTVTEFMAIATLGMRGTFRETLK